MTYAELEANIYEIISTALSSITIIWADENGTRPDEKYLTLKILPANPIGQTAYGEPDANGDRINFYCEDFALSVIGHGRNTNDDLRTLKNYLESELGMELMKEKKLATRNDGTITDISTQISTEIEKRYLYEQIWGLSSSFEENVGLIENFEYSKTINQPV